MRTYSSLVISSDTDPHLKATVQRVLGLKSDDFVDTQTPELIARRARFSNFLQVAPSLPPRYFWRLSSKEMLKSSKTEVHISWILNQVRPGQSIQEIRKYGSSAYLTCFWAGNGRGGGPVISSELVQAVANHGIELQFDFYIEDEDTMDTDSLLSY